MRIVARGLAIAGALLIVLGFWPTRAAAWRGQVRGGDVELTGYVETRQVVRVDRDTEHELNLQRLQLEARSWWDDWASFTLVTSLQNGGPATRSSSAGFYDIDRVFQSIAPAVEIEEASLRFDFDRFEFRFGQLKHAWGKLDRFQPNDEINPERYADPLLLEEQERKIGVPSLEATVHLPERWWLPEEGAVTFVSVPRFVPFRMPLPGERWFPPNAVPPASLAVELAPGEIADVPLSLQVDNRRPPAFTFDNASYAARFAAHWRGADYALYYYRGIQTAPVFDLDARADVADVAPGVTGTTILSPVFHHIQSWGTDVGFVWDRFSFRAEGAFTRGRAFNRDLRSLIDDPQLQDAIDNALEELQSGASTAPVDLGTTFIVSDTVQWGVGADTAIHDFDLLFELSQTHVLDNDLPLLIRNNETVLLADIRRRFLRDDLTAQMTALYGASSDYTALMPRLTYRLHDRVELRVGYLHVAGRARSRVGQFKDNDEAFIRLRLYL